MIEKGYISQEELRWIKDQGVEKRYNMYLDREEKECYNKIAKVKTGEEAIKIAGNIEQIERLRSVFSGMLEIYKSNLKQTEKEE